MNSQQMTYSPFCIHLCLAAPSAMVYTSSMLQEVIFSLLCFRFAFVFPTYQPVTFLILTRQLDKAQLSYLFNSNVCFGFRVSSYFEEYFNSFIEKCSTFFANFIQLVCGIHAMQTLGLLAYSCTKPGQTVGPKQPKRSKGPNKHGPKVSLYPEKARQINGFCQNWKTFFFP